MLTLSAVGLRFFAATLDPYLNEWDEGFHALVAKNMMADPFTPRLHWEEAMPVSHHWTQSHVWLHKPPFFLWQIALSLGIFGLEPWAVRLPSVLWLSLLVPVVYRIGLLLVNGRVAFVAALFTCFSYYLEELTAAAVCTDHNDAIFIATVACSWWALLEYWERGHWRWALLVGVFGACAVLTKWYVGLSVFLPWGLALVVKRSNGREWVRFGGALAIVVVLAGTWVASIWSRFRESAAVEFGFDADHFTHPVEAHHGSWTYHFDVVSHLIPPYTWWIVIPAVGWLVWTVKRIEHRVFVAALFVTIHLFFAIAQTKMVSYTMVLFPIYAVAIAHAMVALVQGAIVERFREVSFALAAILLSAFMLDMERLQYRHTVYAPPRIDQCWRQQQLGAMAPMDHLVQLIEDPPHSVVFNIPALHHIQFMFKTGIEAWDSPPVSEDVERLRAKGYTVYAVQDGIAPDQFPRSVVLIPDSLVSFPNVGRP